jgi:DnaJ-class molecular chaperone
MDDCKACHGTGMLADDEGWQYECSVCHGTGEVDPEKEVRIYAVDDNNRLLD